MTDNLKEYSAPEAVKIRRNKCFKDDFAGFDCVKPINIVIGRNNSGKSVLLDMIEFLVTKNHNYWDTKESEDRIARVLDDQSEFLFSRILSENTLKRIFPENAFGGDLPGSHWGTGSQLVSYVIEFNVAFDLKSLSVNIPEAPFSSPHFPYFRYKNRSATPEDLIEIACHYIAKDINGGFMPDSLTNKTFRRLSAERDIVPEEQNDVLSLEINGTGAANIIQAFLHNAELDRSVVRDSLLEGLNKIFEPDNTFVEITSQYHQSNKKWEVFLNEKNKGLIPLSKSGSGLKTVLLVLLNLLAVPHIPSRNSELKDTKNYIFAFEELENNLHPSLLRRLYRFIADFAEKEQSIFFITTHSSAVIDFFSQSDSAQIVHVTHDGERAKTETVYHFVGQNAVLDDLGVRASDLLQANGIVWIEGPSDRIYFNKWVEIYSEGNLREHRDYECAFYGGTILAHYHAVDPNDDDGDFVNIFRINRNAILLADSDKKTETSPLKQRVERMKEQIKQTRGIFWDFSVKEIENYIPPECIRLAFNLENALPPLHKHLVFSNYFKKVVGKAFDKVKLARTIAPELTEAYLASRFDLPERMKEICSVIKNWQGKAEIDATHSKESE